MGAKGVLGYECTACGMGRQTPARYWVSGRGEALVACKGRLYCLGRASLWRRRHADLLRAWWLLLLSRKLPLAACGARTSCLMVSQLWGSCAVRCTGCPVAPLLLSQRFVSPSIFLLLRDDIRIVSVVGSTCRLLLPFACPAAKAAWLDSGVHAHEVAWSTVG